MAQILVTANAATSLLSTLGKVINEITGDMKSDFERLERHVRSMDHFYQARKEDPLYLVEGLQTAWQIETALVEDTNERLKRLTQPQNWDITHKQELKNFIEESERNLQQSSQTMNNLLTHIVSSAIIQILNQQQNDPDSTDIERSNAAQSGVTMASDVSGNVQERSRAGQSGVTMASGVSGNIQDSTNANQTDNDNVTMDSVVSSEVLNEIAKEISVKWKDVGRQLGLKEAELFHIHVEHLPSYREKAYAILSLWRASKNRPTYRELADALVKVGRRDLRDIMAANYQS